ncbi:RHS repeat protein [Salmonella enterica]|nr:RHS repeat protein [Salmonella enterica]EKT7776862.1 RHS repeat protein [Salmonella enterica]
MRWAASPRGNITATGISHDCRCRGGITLRYRYDNNDNLIRFQGLGNKIWLFDYDELGSLRCVTGPLGRQMLWEHETKFAYNGQGLANRFRPDSLPPVEWLTYGSGYLAGMKLGDRLATIRTQQRRVQTVYAPGSFTPLLRVETENTELAKTRHRSLAERLEQEGSGDGEAVQFPAALRAMLERLEDELRRDAVSEESRAWLTQCGLTAEQMKNQLEPRPEPERKVHLYHCDLPLALISPANTVAWCAEYDEWGNLLGEENPEHLEQLIRLPGQQYDEESGLHYNRHRYYSPGQGRYITQDPIGQKGG